MKRNLLPLVVFLLILSGFGLSIAGVGGSNHDLSINGSGNFSAMYSGEDNDEVCVYCHTPHGSTGGQMPLWNRTLNFPNGFTVYSSSSMDSTPAATPSTISLLCLSCHDGVTAINALLNTPGPGSTPFTNSGTDRIGDLGPLAKFVNIGNGDPSGPAAPVDLSDDHPVSMPWADRGPDFHATPTNANLKLFNDSTVECTTCHDPHNGAPMDATNMQFMRMSNAGSGLCLACHIK